MSLKKNDKTYLGIEIIAINRIDYQLRITCSNNLKFLVINLSFCSYLFIFRLE